MRSQIVAMATTMLAAGILISACSQAAPAPAATKAPAPAPTTAASAPASAPATSAPAAAATPAPAAAAYPEKGKTMTIIVPWAAGGSTDLIGRLVGAELEKTLGNGLTVDVVNKPGAGSQVGLTELAQSRADGYTFGVVDLPTTVLIYLDPSRQAAFSRKSFQFIATLIGGPGTPAVQVNSPYKTMKDLVDAAKANPGKIKAGDPGVLTFGNVLMLQIEKVTGVKFAVAHFDSGATNMAALMGGHEDVLFTNASDSAPKVVDHSIRVIGVADTQRSELLPDVPTLTEQGYPVVGRLDQAFVAPAGTPKAAVDAVSNALGKILNNKEFQDKLKNQYQMVTSYKTPQQTEAYIDQLDTTMPDIVKMAKEQQ